MKAVILAIAVVLASCAFAQDQDKPAVAKAKAACGPSDVEFDVTTDKTSQPAGQAEDGKALVYIIEEHIGSCGITCRPTTKVGLDGSWVGANQGDSYFSFAVAAGEHHLCANWQSKFAFNRRLVALTNFIAEAGKVYYFRMRIEEVKGRSVFDLDPVNSDQAQLLVASFPLSTAHTKK